MLSEKMAATEFTNEQMESFVEQMVPVNSTKKQKVEAMPAASWTPDNNVGLLDQLVNATASVAVPTDMIPTKTAKARAKIMELVNCGAGMENIRGTAWGAYNAYTEYLDHYSQYKETKNSSKEDNRFASVLLDGSVQKKKDKAFQLICEMVELNA